MSDENNDTKKCKLPKVSHILELRLIYHIVQHFQTSTPVMNAPFVTQPPLICKLQKSRERERKRGSSKRKEEGMRWEAQRYIDRKYNFFCVTLTHKLRFRQFFYFISTLNWKKVLCIDIREEGLIMSHTFSVALKSENQKKVFKC